MTDDQTANVVVVLSVDLMDRSKISAALPNATIVRSIDKVIEAAPTATLVIVDLNRVEDLAVLGDIETRVVGYGSHVDETLLAAATEAGAEALPRSLFFRRLSDGIL